MKLRDRRMRQSESVEFFLYFGKSYSCLAKASGDTFRLSVGAAIAMRQHFSQAFPQDPGRLQ